MKKEELKNNQDFQTLRERVRILLAERGLTQVDLAKKMGMTTGGLAIGQQSFSPSLKSLKMYADAIGVPTWELLHDCGESYIADDGNKESVLNITCSECGTELDICISITEKYDMGANSIMAPIVQDIGVDVQERVQRIMKRKEMTTRKLADRCGTSTAVIIGNLKSTNPSLSVLSRLAKGLDVEVWELLTERYVVEHERLRRAKLKARNRVVKMEATMICPHCHKLIEVNI